MYLRYTPEENKYNKVLNRKEFIENVKKKHFTERDNESGIKSRWDYLHNLGKLKKEKLNEKIQQNKEKKEAELMNECTFSPKLYKSNSSHNLYVEPNLIKRQIMWEEKKKSNLKKLKKFKKMTEKKECYFSPEINKKDDLEKSKMDSSAVHFLEDPESYELYLKRLNKKRENIEDQRKKEENAPGSGNIWRPKRNKYNTSYDYTKHEITDKTLSNFNNTNRIIDFDSPLNASSYLKNKNLMRNMNKEDYYQYLFDNKISRNNKPDPYRKNIQSQIQNNTKNLNDNEVLQNGKIIEYSKAVDLLHNELFSFQLISDN
ncbi:MAG: hypothetical protein MJ252_14540 [archaeon]|nr:hypothetical protein [archaeon]